MTLQRVRSTSYSVCSAFDQSWAPPTPWCARHIPTNTRYECQPHVQPRLSPFCKPTKAYLEARAVEAHVPIGQIINERDQTRHDRVQAVRYIVPARETREKVGIRCWLGEHFTICAGHVPFISSITNWTSDCVDASTHWSITLSLWITSPWWISKRRPVSWRIPKGWSHGHASISHPTADFALVLNMGIPPPCAWRSAQRNGRHCTTAGTHP